MHAEYLKFLWHNQLFYISLRLKKRSEEWKKKPVSNLVCSKTTWAACEVC